jgi:hypothetical protein
LRPYGGSLFSGLGHRGVLCYWLQGTAEAGPNN